MRKIVQILHLPESTRYEAGLLALCDDGTAWLLVSDKWKQLPKIPQEPQLPQCKGLNFGVQVGKR